MPDLKPTPLPDHHPQCGKQRHSGKDGGPVNCPHCSEVNRREKANWVREDFDEWSELTKERDGYREDAIAEMHRRDREGF